VWKIAVIVLVILFLVIDSIYLYFRLKKYWQSSSWKRPGQNSKKWKLGLSSLDIPLNKNPDTAGQPPEKP
jgi:hypothetical protein